MIFSIFLHIFTVYMLRNKQKDCLLKKFSVVYFSHRRAARINKKYLRQLLRVPRGVRNFVLAALQSVAVNLMGVLIKVNIWLI